MNVHLTDELERLVQSRVQSGRYNSASEVVREALRLLEERGAFEMRRSAETVAEALGVTRFTVYNYLNRRSSALTPDDFSTNR